MKASQSSLIQILLELFQKKSKFRNICLPAGMFQSPDLRCWIPRRNWFWNVVDRKAWDGLKRRETGKQREGRRETMCKGKGKHGAQDTTNGEWTEVENHFVSYVMTARGEIEMICTEVGRTRQMPLGCCQLQKKRVKLHKGRGKIISGLSFCGCCPWRTSVNKRWKGRTSWGWSGVIFFSGYLSSSSASVQNLLLHR